MVPSSSLTSFIDLIKAIQEPGCQPTNHELGSCGAGGAAEQHGSVQQRDWRLPLRVAHDGAWQARQQAFLKPRLCARTPELLHGHGDGPAAGTQLLCGHELTARTQPCTGKGQRGGPGVRNTACAA
eukprot:365925-Chlamydomonas_euryale.AAC.9